MTHCRASTAESVPLVCYEMPNSLFLIRISDPVFFPHQRADGDNKQKQKKLQL